MKDQLVLDSSGTVGKARTAAGECEWSRGFLTVKVWSCPTRKRLPSWNPVPPSHASSTFLTFRCTCALHVCILQLNLKALGQG